MRSVGIKVLKDKLSEYLRAAQAGETVLVTDHNRVVAEIKPHRPKDDADHPLMKDPFFARGVREGWITLPTVPPGTPLPERHPVMSHKELMRQLDEDRADRF